MSGLVAVAATTAALSGWLMVTGTGTGTGTGRAGLAVGERLATPARVVVLGVVLAVVAPRAWLAPGLVGLTVAWAGWRLWRRRSDGRQAEQAAESLAQVCDLVAAELAAGVPPQTALDEAAAAWAVVAPVAEAARLGGDVPAALREAADMPGAGGLRLLAGAWAVSQRSGAGLSGATARVAAAIRREQATRRLVAAELASARATARLVAGLPLLALLMGSGAGGDPWAFLLETPGGWACLTAGSAAGLAGLWWIEQIARTAGA